MCVCKCLFVNVCLHVCMTNTHVRDNAWDVLRVPLHTITRRCVSVLWSVVATVSVLPFMCAGIQCAHCLRMRSDAEASSLIPSSVPSHTLSPRATTSQPCGKSRNPVGLKRLWSCHPPRDCNLSVESTAGHPCTPCVSWGANVTGRSG